MTSQGAMKVQTRIKRGEKGEKKEKSHVEGKERVCGAL